MIIDTDAMDIYFELERLKGEKNNVTTDKSVLFSAANVPEPNLSANNNATTERFNNANERQIN